MNHSMIVNDYDNYRGISDYSKRTKQTQDTSLVIPIMNMNVRASNDAVNMLFRKF